MWLHINQSCVLWTLRLVTGPREMLSPPWGWPCLAPADKEPTGTQGSFLLHSLVSPGFLPAWGAMAANAPPIVLYLVGQKGKGCRIPVSSPS